MCIIRQFPKYTAIIYYYIIHYIGHINLLTKRNDNGIT